MCYHTALAQMIRHCTYAEDLDALRHFVFHPRRNGCSNVCMLCDSAVDTGENNPQDHTSVCPYGQAMAKLEPRRGELQRWIDDY